MSTRECQFGYGLGLRCPNASVRPAWTGVQARTGHQRGLSRAQGHLESRQQPTCRLRAFFVLQPCLLPRQRVMKRGASPLTRKPVRRLLSSSSAPLLQNDLSPTGVLTLTFNQPEKLNAWTLPLLNKARERKLQ